MGKDWGKLDKPEKKTRDGDYTQSRPHEKFKDQSGPLLDLLARLTKEATMPDNQWHYGREDYQTVEGRELAHRKIKTLLLSKPYEWWKKIDTPYGYFTDRYFKAINKDVLWHLGPNKGVVHHKGLTPLTGDEREEFLKPYLDCLEG